MSGTVSEALARPLRTSGHLLVANVVTEFIDAVVYNMNDRQYLAVAALLTIFFSFLQAAIENYTGKAVLRTIPPADVPVVDG